MNIKILLLTLVALFSTLLAQTSESTFSSDRMLLHLNPKGQVGSSFKDIPAIKSVRPAFPGLGMDHILELRFTETTDISALKNQLESLPSVLLAERIPFVHSSYVPGDLDSTRDYQLPLLNAPDAWDSTRGSSEVVIAVVDNGVLLSHDELSQALWQNPNEVPGDNIDNDGNGWIDDYRGYDIADDDDDPTISSRAFRHGTHIAGLIAASPDNGSGSAGLAHGCRILPVKVASSNGFADSYPLSDALRGVAYAVASGADVICMAWGGTDSLLAAHLLMERARERGIILVAAAGNGPGDGNPFTNDSTLEYPASYRAVVSVAATDELDQKAIVSTANRRVSLCAPGELIYGPIPSAGLNSSYTRMRGSSQATAIASAAFGLLLSHRPCLTPDEAIAIMEQSCVDIDPQNPGMEGKLGAGRIDIHAALQALGSKPQGAVDFVVLDTVTCSGNMRLQYTGLGCPDSLNWEGPGGRMAEGWLPVFAIDSNGTYQICLKVWQNGQMDSLCKSVDITIDKGLTVTPKDSLLAFGDSVLLQAQGPVGLYTWEPKASFAGLLIGEAVWYHPEDSNWVYLQVITDNGCRLKDSVFIGLIAPDGLEDDVESELLIYPNPVQKGFFIQNPRQHVIDKLELVDALGRTVWTYEGRPEAGQFFEVEGLGTGIYILLMYTKSGKNYIKTYPIYLFNED